jgi:hypothetical protein
MEIEQPENRTLMNADWMHLYASLEKIVLVLVLGSSSRTMTRGFDC